MRKTTKKCSGHETVNIKVSLPCVYSVSILIFAWHELAVCVSCLCERGDFYARTTQSCFLRQTTSAAAGACRKAKRIDRWNRQEGASSDWREKEKKWKIEENTDRHRATEKKEGRTRETRVKRPIKTGRDRRTSRHGNQSESVESDRLPYKTLYRHCSCRELAAGAWLLLGCRHSRRVVRATEIAAPIHGRKVGLADFPL